jgi:membrane fusion protein (multidrug efflux system)
MNRRRLIAPVLLIGVVVATGSALAAWKHSALEQADLAAASQPEPAESVAVAVAREREHSPSTTSIGTVVALRSISVRNELAGTVSHVSLVPGQIVTAGTVLVALDVSVEEAELRAQQAQASLAETQFARMQRMVQQRAASEMEVDTARAERDVALAQIARTQAVIARKTIRAPFRARVGISDVHPGQYLNEGSLLTTLQGVDDRAYIDFTVAQQIAARLRAGDTITVVGNAGSTPTSAQIVAVDSRVDSATRNAAVRAQIENKLIADDANALTPGASVRVQVPVGVSRLAIAIPASAVRKGPDGDHVFVLIADDAGNMRARVRQVRIDTVAGDEALIETGLSVGEKVAASGSFKLRDSALVAIIGTPPQSVALNQTAPVPSAAL